MLFDSRLKIGIIKESMSPTRGVLKYSKLSRQFSMSYLSKTYEEMKKVIWPSRSVVLATTALVIVISLLVAYYLGAFDLLFKTLLEFIIG
jgi:preprotein translocase SecE subunit